MGMKQILQLVIKKKMACYKFFSLIVKLSGYISREQKFSSVKWKLAFHRPTMHQQEEFQLLIKIKSVL